MLASFLNLHEATPERFGIKDVIAATYINVTAAHEAVAISLRAIVYNLAKHPAVQKRLALEISDAVNAKRLSNPATYAETATLSYLYVTPLTLYHKLFNVCESTRSAVVTEALRLHPGTGLILERIVPKGGFTIHGTYIPEKTIIGVNCWVVNRDKTIFGDDAHEFRPERWIDSEPGMIQRMRINLFSFTKSHALLQFSAGSRSCIGKNIAMMLIKKLTVEIYRSFEVVLADPEKEWRVSGGWLTRQTNMNMVLEKRTKLVLVSSEASN
ncbi:hypothetical protein BOTCAL_1612g00010 [Botryotinia calthae]|uniref:Cytochrome P450 n=1 Tax=Botryotinia calthae TaxID=38488 RepID=A0A4Y8CB70_9HELO|nr:hypothetical protein BOTCAL_1612g00010 [Botryotinia calthae]